MKFLLSLFILLSACRPPEKVIEREKIIQEIEVPVERPNDANTPLPNDPPGFVSVQRMTEAMNNYAESFPRAIQENIAFVNACNFYNSSSNKDMTEIEQAINKMLNLLSRERELVKVQNLAPIAPCAFGYNMKSLGWTRLQYWMIEEELFFDLAPQGDREQLLRFLTQKRRPWIHASELAMVTFGENQTTGGAKNLYYILTGQNFDDFENFLLSKGVDLEEAVEDRELAMAGFTSSPIALGKSRGVIFAPSTDGMCILTMDSDKGSEDNIIENFAIPELLRIDGDKRIDESFLFNTDAFEVICTKRNGMFGDYSLRGVNNFKVGKLEHIAPATIVNNVNFNFIDPQIQIIDCQNCHNSGVIEVRDEVLNSVIGNPLIPGDTKKAVEIFFNPLRVSGYTENINRNHRNAMIDLGITSQTDPVNRLVVFPIRQEMDLKFVAGIFQINEQEFKRKLEGSGQSRTILSNLLIGGKVSLGTLIRAFPIVVDELNLFKDPEDF